MRSFEFTLDESGVWEDITSMEGITEEECISLLEKWVNDDQVPVYGKTYGEVTESEESWNVSGRVLDEPDLVGERFSVVIPK